MSRPAWRVGTEQTYALARRSVLNMAVEPSAWLPAIFFPIMLAVVYGAQFSRATELPGFPEVDSFLQFVLPASILQGISFNAGEAGTGMATDIEGGFFDRLVTSPSSRLSIFVGRLAGAVAFSGALAVVLIVIFALMGAPVQGGLGAALAIVVVSMALSLAIGGFNVAVALKTGSAEAAQSVFPLIFVAIFVSSAFFPTELMDGWYQDVAEVNPITLIVDPTRRIALGGFDLGDLGRALGWCAALSVLSLTIAYRAYLSRLSD